jgi:hypothetical protein
MAKLDPTPEERARADALREVAIELRAIEDTLDYLEGIRSHKRAILRGALEAKGQRSSETIVRGVQLALSPFEIIVCTCHGQSVGACPTATTGQPVIFETRVNGDYLSVRFGADFPRNALARFDEVAFPAVAFEVPAA